MGKNRTLACILHGIEDGIEGAQNNSEIQERMTKYGYTPERIGAGKQLLIKARQLTAYHTEKYGNKYSATDEMAHVWTATYGDYMVTVKVVRVAFRKQPGRLQEFKATGLRRRSLSGWLSDARVMYENLLHAPDALTEMEKYGYTEERLVAEQERVEEVARLHNRQLSETGAAQQLTQDRDQAIDALCNWFSDFRAIARIALYDKPQWLEALGIRVK